MPVAYTAYFKLSQDKEEKQRWKGRKVHYLMLPSINISAVTSYHQTQAIHFIFESQAFKGQIGPCFSGFVLKF